MLRIAVCDDEPEMAKALSSLISACLTEEGAAEHQIGLFSSGRALLESGRDYDLIFLDIRLDGGAACLPAAPDAFAAPALSAGPAAPDAMAFADDPADPAAAPGDAGPQDGPAASLTGMQTARLLRRQGSGGLLVFVTALPEYVFDAFSVEAFDYLVKPVAPTRLARTLKRALQALVRRAEQGFVVRQPGGSEVVRPGELGWCEVQGRKVYLHRTDGTVVAYYDRLQQLERRLDSRFFRCHRSYLVNLDEVRGCADGLITLRQGESVPLSRQRVQELSAALLRRMKGREGQNG